MSMKYSVVSASRELRARERDEIKPYCTVGYDGDIYTDEIAAFDNEEEALAFVSKYKPEFRSFSNAGMKFYYIKEYMVEEYEVDEDGEYCGVTVDYDGAREFEFDKDLDNIVLK